MAVLDRITEGILKQIDDKGFEQKGAYNLRYNGISLCHGDSEHVKIRRKIKNSDVTRFIESSYVIFRGQSSCVILARGYHGSLIYGF